MNKGIISLLCILLCACELSSGVETISVVSPSGESIDISAEIATTDYQRAEGLMHRIRLEEGHGMLFIFDEQQPLAFWMKNTVIPLDILYFDSNKNLVSSASMVPCEADPCKGYPSDSPAQYALEVPVGFVEMHGVGDGWHLK